MQIGDTIISDDQQKAEKFNNFFLKNSNIDDSHAHIPPTNDNSDSTLSNIHVKTQDVADLLKCLNVSKATGPDIISHSMLKMAGDIIAPSLQRLFNLSLQKAVFPQSWKRANVVPIYKKNEKSIPDNYRPVSLLSCVSKLFERCVFKYVFNFLRDTHAISIKQSGFKPGDSTVYQLTYLYHIFAEALDRQKELRIVFCDISKAFDRVWHPGLLNKLLKTGISGTLYKWFENYLTNREQRVVINGQCSSWGKINSGVPQGSVLGPLLFLIFINDVTEVVKSSEIRLFADDTILYLFVDNPITSAVALDEDLKSLDEWANKWLIKFSPSKTKTMLVSKKKKILSHPKLSMGETNLDEVKSHKHLGLILSHDLSWSEHIEDLATRASQSLEILNALKHKLDRATLEKLYIAFVRSKLEYSCITWDNCSNQLSDMLENINYRAAKIISGAIHRTSHNIVYGELGWESLKE